MGIKDLLKNLNEAKEIRPFSDFRGTVIAIDGFVWLHKALKSKFAASKFVQGCRDDISAREKAHKTAFKQKHPSQPYPPELLCGRYPDSILDSSSDEYPLFIGCSANCSCTATSQCANLPSYFTEEDFVKLLETGDRRAWQWLQHKHGHEDPHHVHNPWTSSRVSSSTSSVLSSSASSSSPSTSLSSLAASSESSSSSSLPLPPATHHSSYASASSPTPSASPARAFSPLELHIRASAALSALPSLSFLPPRRPLSYGHYSSVLSACLANVIQLVQHGITPIVVLDGQRLPAKQDTEISRAKTRKDALAKGLRLQDRKADALEVDNTLRSAVGVDSELVWVLARVLESYGVPLLGSPGEADAQLGRLYREDVVDAVVSIDSDLILHGVGRLITQVDHRNASFELIDCAKLHRCAFLAPFTRGSRVAARAEQVCVAYERAVAQYGYGYHRAMRVWLGTQQERERLWVEGQAREDRHRKRKDREEEGTGEGSGGMHGIDGKRKHVRLRVDVPDADSAAASGFTSASPPVSRHTHSSHSMPAHGPLSLPSPLASSTTTPSTASGTPSQPIPTSAVSLPISLGAAAMASLHASRLQWLAHKTTTTHALAVKIEENIGDSEKTEVSGKNGKYRSRSIHFRARSNASGSLVSDSSNMGQNRNGLCADGSINGDINAKTTGNDGRNGDIDGTGAVNDNNAGCGATTCRLDSMLLAARIATLSADVEDLCGDDVEADARQGEEAEGGAAEAFKGGCGVRDGAADGARDDDRNGGAVSGGEGGLTLAVPRQEHAAGLASTGNYPGFPDSPLSSLTSSSSLPSSLPTPLTFPPRALARLLPSGPPTALPALFSYPHPIRLPTFPPPSENDFFPKNMVFPEIQLPYAQKFSDDVFAKLNAVSSSNSANSLSASSRSVSSTLSPEACLLLLPHLPLASPHTTAPLLLLLQLISIASGCDYAASLAGVGLVRARDSVFAAVGPLDALEAAMRGRARERFVWECVAGGLGYGCGLGDGGSGSGCGQCGVVRSACESADGGAREEGTDAEGDGKEDHVMSSSSSSTAAHFSSFSCSCSNPLAAPRTHHGHIWSTSRTPLCRSPHRALHRYLLAAQHVQYAADALTMAALVGAVVSKVAGLGAGKKREREKEKEKEKEKERERRQRGEDVDVLLPAGSPPHLSPSPLSPSVSSTLSSLSQASLPPQHSASPASSLPLSPNPSRTPSLPLSCSSTAFLLFVTSAQSAALAFAPTSPPIATVPFVLTLTRPTQALPSALPSQPLPPGTIRSPPPSLLWASDTSTACTPPPPPSSSSCLISSFARPALLATPPARTHTLPHAAAPKQAPHTDAPSSQPLLALSSSSPALSSQLASITSSSTSPRPLPRNISQADSDSVFSQPLTTMLSAAQVLGAASRSPASAHALLGDSTAVELSPAAMLPVCSGEVCIPMPDNDDDGDGNCNDGGDNGGVAAAARDGNRSHDTDAHAQPPPLALSLSLVVGSNSNPNNAGDNGRKNAADVFVAASGGRGGAAAADAGEGVSTSTQLLRHSKDQCDIKGPGRSDGETQSGGVQDRMEGDDDADSADVYDSDWDKITRACAYLCDDAAYVCALLQPSQYTHIYSACGSRPAPHISINTASTNTNAKVDTNTSTFSPAAGLATSSYCTLVAYPNEADMAAVEDDSALPLPPPSLALVSSNSNISSDVGSSNNLADPSNASMGGEDLSGATMPFFASPLSPSLLSSSLASPTLSPLPSSPPALLPSSAFTRLASLTNARAECGFSPFLPFTYITPTLTLVLLHPIPTPLLPLLGSPPHSFQPAFTASCSQSNTLPLPLYTWPAQPPSPHVHAPHAYFLSFYRALLTFHHQLALAATVHTHAPHAPHTREYSSFATARDMATRNCEVPPIFPPIFFQPRYRGHSSPPSLSSRSSTSPSDTLSPLSSPCFSPHRLQPLDAVAVPAPANSLTITIALSAVSHTLADAPMRAQADTHGHPSSPSTSSYTVTFTPPLAPPPPLHAAAAARAAHISTLSLPTLAHLQRLADTVSHSCSCSPYTSLLALTPEHLNHPLRALTRMSSRALVCYAQRTRNMARTHADARAHSNLSADAPRAEGDVAVAVTVAADSAAADEAAVNPGSGSIAGAPGAYSTAGGDGGSAAMHADGNIPSGNDLVSYPPCSSVRGLEDAGVVCPDCADLWEQHFLTPSPSHSLGLLSSSSCSPWSMPVLPRYPILRGDPADADYVAWLCDRSARTHADAASIHAVHTGDGTTTTNIDALAAMVPTTAVTNSTHHLWVSPRVCTLWRDADTSSIDAQGAHTPLSYRDQKASARPDDDYCLEDHCHDSWLLNGLNRQFHAVLTAVIGDDRSEPAKGRSEDSENSNSGNLLGKRVFWNMFPEFTVSASRRVLAALSAAERVECARAQEMLSEYEVEVLDGDVHRQAKEEGKEEEGRGEREQVKNTDGRELHGCWQVKHEGQLRAGQKIGITESDDGEQTTSISTMAAVSQNPSSRSPQHHSQPPPQGMSAWERDEHVMTLWPRRDEAGSVVDTEGERAEERAALDVVDASGADCSGDASGASVTSEGTVWDHVHASESVAADASLPLPPPPPPPPHSTAATPTPTTSWLSPGTQRPSSSWLACANAQAPAPPLLSASLTAPPAACISSPTHRSKPAVTAPHFRTQMPASAPMSTQSSSSSALSSSPSTLSASYAARALTAVSTRPHAVLGSDMTGWLHSVHVSGASSSAGSGANKHSAAPDSNGVAGPRASYHTRTSRAGTCTATASTGNAGRAASTASLPPGRGVRATNGIRGVNSSGKDKDAWLNHALSLASSTETSKSSTHSSTLPSSQALHWQVCLFDENLAATARVCAPSRIGWMHIVYDDNFYRNGDMCCNYYDNMLGHGDVWRLGESTASLKTSVSTVGADRDRADTAHTRSRTASPSPSGYYYHNRYHDTTRAPAISVSPLLRTYCHTTTHTCHCPSNVGAARIGAAGAVRPSSSANLSAAVAGDIGAASAHITDVIGAAPAYSISTTSTSTSSSSASSSSSSSSHPLSAQLSATPAVWLLALAETGVDVAGATLLMHAALQAKAGAARYLRQDNHERKTQVSGRGDAQVCANGRLRDKIDGKTVIAVTPSSLPTLPFLPSIGACEATDDVDVSVEGGVGAGADAGVDTALDDGAIDGVTAGVGVTAMKREDHWVTTNTGDSSSGVRDESVSNHAGDNDMGNIGDTSTEVGSRDVVLAPSVSALVTYVDILALHSTDPLTPPRPHTDAFNHCPSPPRPAPLLLPSLSSAALYMPFAGALPPPHLLASLACVAGDPEAASVKEMMKVMPVATADAHALPASTLSESPYSSSPSYSLHHQQQHVLSHWPGIGASTATRSLSSAIARALEGIESAAKQALNKALGGTSAATAHTPTLSTPLPHTPAPYTAGQASSSPSTRTVFCFTPKSGSALASPATTNTCVNAHATPTPTLTCANDLYGIALQSPLPLYQHQLPHRYLQSLAYVQFPWRDITLPPDTWVTQRAQLAPNALMTTADPSDSQLHGHSASPPSSQSSPPLSPCSPWPPSSLQPSCLPPQPRELTVPWRSISLTDLRQHLQACLTSTYSNTLSSAINEHVQTRGHTWKAIVLYVHPESGKMELSIPGNANFRNFANSRVGYWKIPLPVLVGELLRMGTGEGVGSPRANSNSNSNTYGNDNNSNGSARGGGSGGHITSAWSTPMRGAGANTPFRPSSRAATPRADNSNNGNNGSSGTSTDTNGTAIDIAMVTNTATSARTGADAVRLRVDTLLHTHAHASTRGAPTPYSPFHAPPSPFASPFSPYVDASHSPVVPTGPFSPAQGYAPPPRTPQHQHSHRPQQSRQQLQSPAHRTQHSSAHPSSRRGGDLLRAGVLADASTGAIHADTATVLWAVKQCVFRLMCSSAGAGVCAVHATDTDGAAPSPTAAPASNSISPHTHTSTSALVCGCCQHATQLLAAAQWRLLRAMARSRVIECVRAPCEVVGEAKDVVMEEQGSAYGGVGGADVCDDASVKAIKTTIPLATLATCTPTAPLLPPRPMADDDILAATTVIPSPAPVLPPTFPPASTTLTPSLYRQASARTRRGVVSTPAATAAAAPALSTSTSSSLVTPSAFSPPTPVASPLANSATARAIHTAIVATPTSASATTTATTTLSEDVASPPQYSPTPRSSTTRAAHDSNGAGVGLTAGAGAGAVVSTPLHRLSVPETSPWAWDEVNVGHDTPAPRRSSRKQTPKTAQRASAVASAVGTTPGTAAAATITPASRGRRTGGRAGSGGHNMLARFLSRTMQSDEETSPVVDADATETQMPPQAQPLPPTVPLPDPLSQPLPQPTTRSRARTRAMSAQGQLHPAVMAAGSAEAASGTHIATVAMSAATPTPAVDRSHNAGVDGGAVSVAEEQLSAHEIFDLTRGSQTDDAGVDAHRDITAGMASGTRGHSESDDGVVEATGVIAAGTVTSTVAATITVATTSMAIGEVSSAARSDASLATVSSAHSATWQHARTQDRATAAPAPRAGMTSLPAPVPVPVYAERTGRTSTFFTATPATATSTAPLANTSSGSNGIGVGVGGSRPAGGVATGGLVSPAASRSAVMRMYQRAARATPTPTLSTSLSSSSSFSTSTLPLPPSTSVYTSSRSSATSLTDIYAVATHARQRGRSVADSNSNAGGSFDIGGDSSSSLGASSDSDRRVYSRQRNDDDEDGSEISDVTGGFGGGESHMHMRARMRMRSHAMALEHDRDTDEGGGDALLTQQQERSRLQLQHPHQHRLGTRDMTHGSNTHANGNVHTQRPTARQLPHSRKHPQLQSQGYSQSQSQSQDVEVIDVPASPMSSPSSTPASAATSVAVSVSTSTTTFSFTSTTSSHTIPSAVGTGIGPSTGTRVGTRGRRAIYAAAAPSPATATSVPVLMAASTRVPTHNAYGAVRGSSHLDTSAHAHAASDSPLQSQMLPHSSPPPTQASAPAAVAQGSGRGPLGTRKRPNEAISVEIGDDRGPRRRAPRVDASDVVRLDVVSQEVEVVEIDSD